MKKLFGAIMMLACVLCFASCGGADTPTAVAEKSIQCLQDQDYKGYVDLLNVEAEEGEDLAANKENAVALIQGKAAQFIEKRGGIKSYEVLSEEIAEDGNSAKVKMKVVYGDDKEDEQTVKLVKVDDEWKVDLGK